MHCIVCFSKFIIHFCYLLVKILKETIFFELSYKLKTRYCLIDLILICRNHSCPHLFAKHAALQITSIKKICFRLSYFQLHLMNNLLCFRCKDTEFIKFILIFSNDSNDHLLIVALIKYNRAAI